MGQASLVRHKLRLRCHPKLSFYTFIKFWPFLFINYWIYLIGPLSKKRRSWVWDLISWMKKKSFKKLTWLIWKLLLSLLLLPKSEHYSQLPRRIFFKRLEFFLFIPLGSFPNKSHLASFEDEADWVLQFA